MSPRHLACSVTNETDVNGMNTRPKRKTPQLRLPVAVRRRIREESRMLNLSENNYLLLLTQIATAIRGAVWPNGVKDPEALLSIADNPFVLQIVGALAGTIWSQVKGVLDTEHAPDQAQSAANTAPPPPGRSAPATVTPPMASPQQRAIPGAPPTPPSAQTRPRAASPLIPPPTTSPASPDDGMITLIDPMTGRRVRMHRRSAL